MINYVQVVVPPHRCKRMEIKISTAGLHPDTGKAFRNEVETHYRCSLCYRTMKAPRVRSVSKHGTNAKPKSKLAPRFNN